LANKRGIYCAVEQNLMTEEKTVIRTRTGKKSSVLFRSRAQRVAFGLILEVVFELA